MIHGCYIHLRIVHQTVGQAWINHFTNCPVYHFATVTDCPPFFKWFNHWFGSYRGGWLAVWPAWGPCKAKCWFKFLKKCLKRDSNLSSPVCRASTLAIRQWMLGWVGLIRACGAAATCVWSAYALRPSHFDCLRREWSDLTHMVHARGKAHALLAGGSRVWPAGSIRWVALASWWQIITVDNPLPGQYIQWLIHVGPSVWWTIRKWT